MSHAGQLAEIETASAIAEAVTVHSAAEISVAAANMRAAEAEHEAADALEEAEESVEEALARLEGLIETWDAQREALRNENQQLANQISQLLQTMAPEGELHSRLLKLETSLTELRALRSTTPPAVTPEPEISAEVVAVETPESAGRTPPERPRYKFL